MNPQQTDPVQTDVIGSRKRAKDQFEAQLAQQIPNPVPLIVYYGAPGNGKTALLKALQTYCDTSAASIPWTSLDFTSFVNGKATTTLHEAIVVISNSLQLKAKHYPKSSLDHNRLKHFLHDLQILKKIIESSHPSPTLVKHSSLAPALYTVAQAFQGGAEAAITAAIASFVIFNFASFEALGDSIHGHHSQNLKAFKKAVADEAQLDPALCSAFASLFPSRTDGLVKAVLFFDSYEMAIQSTRSSWVRQMCLLLQQQGILCVVSSQNPFNDRTHTINIPIFGLTSIEADSYVRDHLKGHLEREQLDSMTHEILAACQTKLEKGQRFYRPSLFNVCFDALKIEASKGNGYPKSLQLNNSQGDAAERLIDRTFDVIPAEHRCITTWLQELTVAPMFDEEFAKEVYAKRIQGGNASEDWAFLRELSILTSEEVKEGRTKIHTFYNVSDIYRQQLLKGLTAGDKQNIHRFSVEHWLMRAESMSSQNEYDLYKMEQPYWQSLLSNCLFHLNALEEHVTYKTLLLLTKLLLDFYWWWCENLPHSAWHEMFHKIEAVTDDKQGDVSEVVALFTAFDAAWPKRWQLNPQHWKPETEKNEEERKWNYSVVLASMESLRRIVDDGMEDAAEAEFAELNRLYEYIGAMISYYEGLAYHYGVLASPNLNRASELEKSEEALKKYGDWFENFRPKTHGKLKHTWSLIARADLHTNTKDYASAASYANKALELISEIKKQEGVHREGASSGYHVLATVAMHQGHWKSAGEMMGRALIYSFGFYASDQDEYSSVYHYTYQRECVKKDLRTACKSSPNDMLAYLHGFQAQWQVSPIGEADASPEENLYATFDALPIKIDQNSDAVSAAEFEAAETEFERLDKEIKRGASQSANPIKSS